MGRQRSIGDDPGARLLRALPRSVRGGRVETLVGMSADAARLGAPGDAFDGTLAKPCSATALLDELERLGVGRKARNQAGS